jgi:hypothetical protein
MSNMTLALAFLAFFTAFAAADVQVTASSDTSLKAIWAVPPSDGGAAITKYKVDWDTNGGMAETQVISTSAGSAMGGMRTLISPKIL